MLKVHVVIGGLVAAAMALPVVAASAEPKVATTERIEVTAKADPAFAYTGAEGGWQLVQHTYERVNGRWVDVDNLSHPDYPFARVAAADMVQRYPG